MQKGNFRSFAIISAVFAFGLYSLFPSLICHWKNLNGPMDRHDAQKEIESILHRIDDLKSFSVTWLKHYCRHIGITPKRVQLDHQFPRMIKIAFETEDDTTKCNEMLLRAGHLIPRIGAKLTTLPEEKKEVAKEEEKKRLDLIVSREPALDLKSQGSIEFLQKFDQQGALTDEYQQIIRERLERIKRTLENRSGSILQDVQQTRANPKDKEPLIQAAVRIHEFADALGFDPAFLQRVGKWLVHEDQEEQKELLAQVRHISQRLREKDPKENEKEDQEQLKKKLLSLDRLAFIVQSAQLPVLPKEGEKENYLTVSHPLFKSVATDWDSGCFCLELSEPLRGLLSDDNTERNLIKDWVFSEINRLRELCNEKFTPKENLFLSPLESRPDTLSFLKLDLKPLFEEEKVRLVQFILSNWQPETPELTSTQLPCLFAEEYNNSSPQDRRFSFLVLAPLCDRLDKLDLSQDAHSVYFIFSGYKEILRKKNTDPVTKEKLESDLKTLIKLLLRQGYTLASPDQSVTKAFPDALVLALPYPAKSLIRATREKFQIFENLALLEMSTKKARVAVRNQIENEIQEELLKWRDDYRTNQSDLNPKTSFLVPRPWQSPIWENAKLSFRRYWAGDTQRAIQWGLDLSGGKSVRIALLDQSDQLVTDTKDLLQGREELVKRVNRMGLSEVSVYLEKDSLVFAFPGSQGFSANELIEATSMTFHIVNEQFFQKDDKISEDAHRFLQKIWDEAVVSGHVDRSSLNRLAYEHLHGSKRSEDGMADRLITAGLNFANPKDPEASSALDEKFSTIASFHLDPKQDELPRKHPLTILFRNYALRGSDVSNVHASYDNMRGYFLNFEVKKNNEREENPQDAFKEWTGFYCKEGVAGTPKQIRGERGWRMAVLLDSEVISMPELQSELSTGASISGHFSQREANRLAADLKAGSLSFKPKILSEENISAELGAQEKQKSLFGFQIALLLVAVIMCSYYGFWGLVASIALLFNLFLLFAILQHTGATISLAGLAGIVLTLGMAVDSNVLVFERIREELGLGLPLAEAIHIGYKRAFAAVLDSSITTLLACFILAKFDCGPVKGFAITLSIGIFASIFTAIFSTRTFFSWLLSKEWSFPSRMWNLFSSCSVPLFQCVTPFITLSVLITSLGAICLWDHRSSLFGVDLVGGTTLNLDFPQGSGEMRPRVKQAFEEEGMPPSLYRLQERGSPERLRIYLTNTSYHYFDGASGLCAILEKQGLPIPADTLKKAVDSWASVSGHFSQTMRNNGLIALLLSLLSVLAYLSVRFEWQYGFAALLGILHNLLLTFGFMGLFLFLDYPIQIDIQVIGAIMTIVGYCLNDTIIVFDRIREDLQQSRDKMFKRVIEGSIGATLGRTCMTCLTTLAVLLCLLLFAGQSLFSFSLVMTTGVVIGPFSSCFAAIVLEWLQEKVRPRKQKR
ncbi:protein translocase subunit SecD [Candidatus Similichlamydia laticola]|uniref:Protein-export membrane protein SecD n=1 Tax=Candidatus Similichlamydia laticola TaxID=2170265 RepID=A0A369KEH3_9BACT|nr:protein translocase subunit SecD [Candidatus Similichlamydia laticola]RDB31850.1 Protein-export membrane protein SecD [Candidatus Similichlamydia laticola]